MESKAEEELISATPDMILGVTSVIASLNHRRTEEHRVWDTDYIGRGR